LKLSLCERGGGEQESCGDGTVEKIHGGSLR
jgi:hypothetical protein